MQVQSHCVGGFVTPGEQFIASQSMGALCHLGRRSLAQTHVMHGVAFATLCHMARRLNARCLKYVGRRSGPALESWSHGAMEPWSFVTGWIWLLSRADLHGDERGGANALRGGATDTRAPQSRASQSPFRRRKRKRPEARGSFRPYLWSGPHPHSALKPAWLLGVV